MYELWIDLLNVLRLAVLVGSLVHRVLEVPQRFGIADASCQDIRRQREGGLRSGMHLRYWYGQLAPC